MMRHVRYGVTCAVGVAVLAWRFPAGAEDQFRVLDGKQIEARVVGRDITDGPHWSMYVRPDGVLIGKDSRSSRTGSWKIRNDRFCIRLPSSTSLECNEVRMSGTLIRMRANNDQETFDAMIAAHRNK